VDVVGQLRHVVLGDVGEAFERPFEGEMKYTGPLSGSMSPVRSRSAMIEEMSSSLPGKTNACRPS